MRLPRPRIPRRAALFAVIGMAGVLAALVAVVLVIGPHPAANSATDPSPTPRSAAASPSTAPPSTPQSTVAPTATSPPASTSRPRTPRPAHTATSHAPTPSPADTADLAAGITAVDTLDAQLPAGVELGVAEQDRRTGQILTGKYGETPFYAASVVKLYCVAAILRQKENGSVALTSGDLTAIRLALSASDDAAMNELWEDFGGPELITQIIALARLHSTTAPVDIAQWGETLTTPEDAVAAYDYVLDELQPADREIILSGLAHATDTSADGFDQAFGLLAPPRLPAVKAKQGWIEYADQDYLHHRPARHRRPVRRRSVHRTTRLRRLGWPPRHRQPGRRHPAPSGTPRPGRLIRRPDFRHRSSRHR